MEINIRIGVGALFIYALSYFVYGGIAGIFYIFLLSVAFLVVLQFARIPYLGILIQIGLMYWITTALAATVGLEEMTWVSILLMLIFLFDGVIYAVRAARWFKTFSFFDNEKEKSPLVTPIVLDRFEQENAHNYEEE